MKDVVSFETTDTQKLRPFKLSRRPEVIKYSHATSHFSSVPKLRSWTPQTFLHKIVYFI